MIYVADATQVVFLLLAIVTLAYVAKVLLLTKRDGK